MKAVFIVVMLVLTGCCTAPRVSDTQFVDRLVPVKCEPNVHVTEITDYPTDKMEKSMPLYEKAQLALSENHMLRGQNKELKAALSECTK